MDKRVIVIGAGIAGLTAAYRLAGLGFDVVVLEKEAYPGGRIKSESWQGLSWESGTQFIGGMYLNTLALLKEVGLFSSLLPLKMRVDAISNGTCYPISRHVFGRTYPHLGPLSWNKRLALFKLALFLRSHRRQISISNLAAGIDLDDVNFDAWARNFLGPELVDQYLGPVTRALFFQSAGDISRLVPLTLLGAPCKCRFHTLQGGLSRLPLALAERVPVRKNTRVLRVSTDPKNKTVSVEISLPNGIKETLLANRVVLAIPPGDALSILERPAAAIGRDGLRFLRHSRFVSVSVTCLVLTSPVVKGMYGYVFVPDSHGLTSVSFGQLSSEAGSERDTVTIISTGFDSEVVQTPNHDLLLSANHYFPGLKELTLQRTDYTWQYAIPQFPPGRIKETVSFLRGAKSRELLAFCGDYLGGPGIEGAVSSGLDAAQQIVSTTICSPLRQY